MVVDLRTVLKQCKRVTGLGELAAVSGIDDGTRKVLGVFWGEFIVEEQLLSVSVAQVGTGYHVRLHPVVDFQRALRLHPGRLLIAGTLFGVLGQ